MQDKDLQKLRRADLLEMLVELSRENDTLRKQLAAANAEIANREIMIRESGSIAEASMRINGVLEAVQKAADQYLDNIRRMATGEKVPPAPMQLQKETAASRLGASVLNAAEHGSLEAPKRTATTQRRQVPARIETAQLNPQRANPAQSAQRASARTTTQGQVRKDGTTRPVREKRQAQNPNGQTAVQNQNARPSQAQSGGQRQRIMAPNRKTQQTATSPAASGTPKVDGSNDYVKH